MIMYELIYVLSWFFTQNMSCLITQWIHLWSNFELLMWDGANSGIESKYLKLGNCVYQFVTGLEKYSIISACTVLFVLALFMSNHPRAITHWPILLVHVENGRSPEQESLSKYKKLKVRKMFGWVISINYNNALKSPMELTWPWPPVGRFSHDLTTSRQKET